MLKVNINDAGGDTKVFVMGSGDLFELTAEVAIVINGLYTQLTQSNAALGKEFRRMISQLLIEPNSPLWEIRTDTSGACITIPKNIKEDM